MPPAQPGSVLLHLLLSPWLDLMGRGDRNGGHVHLLNHQSPNSFSQEHVGNSPEAHCTCDGVVGERLDVDEIVVWAVLLQPFAHILLGPQHHWLDQAAQRGAGVVNAIMVTATDLRGVGGGD